MGPVAGAALSAGYSPGWRLMALCSLQVTKGDGGPELKTGVMTEGIEHCAVCLNTSQEGGPLGLPQGRAVPGGAQGGVGDLGLGHV